MKHYYGNRRWIDGVINSIISTIDNLSATGNKLAKSSFWSIIGAIIERGSFFIAFIIIGRLASKEVFGQFGLIFSTVGMFGIFAGFGLQTTAIKYISQYQKSNKIKTGRILALLLSGSSVVAIFSGLAIFVLSNTIAVNLFNDPNFTFTLKISAIFMIFEALYKSQQGILIGFECFKWISGLNALKGLLIIIFVPIAVAVHGINGAYTSFLFAGMIAFCIQLIVILQIASTHRIIIDYRKAQKELSIIPEFAIPAFMSSAMVTPALWLAHAILSNSPSGFIELAIFTAATRFQSAINLFGMSFGNAIIPILQSDAAENEIGVKNSNILISWLIGILFALPIILFPEILTVVFGSKYGGSYESKVLIAVMSFTIVALYKQGLGRIFIVYDKMWYGFLDNVVWGALLIIFSSIFVKHGALGIAIAFLLAYVITTILFVPLYTKNKRVPKMLLYSSNVLIIWFVIILCIIISFYYNFGIGVRLLVSACSTGIIFHQIRGIIGSKIKVGNGIQ